MWTRDRCIEAARVHVDRHGEPPNWRTWKRAGYDHPCSNTVLRLFGSMRALLRAAGIERPDRPDRVWTRDAIVGAFLDWVAAHGRWPSSWDWRFAGDDHPPACTVRYVFGTFAAGKRAAGWLGAGQRGHIGMALAEPIARGLRDYMGDDLSAVQVAALAGVDQTYVQRIVAGKRTTIRADYADRLACLIDRPDLLEMVA